MTTRKRAAGKNDGFVDTIPQKRFARRGDNDMTETMPAFGAERNEKIGKLLGWVKVRGRMYCKSFESRPYAQMPDYCGNDADCFSLLVTLLFIPHFSVSLFNLCGFGVTVTDSFTLTDGFTRFDSLPSEPSNIGLRDAITQAAWKALSAAKETL